MPVAIHRAAGRSAMKGRRASVSDPVGESALHATVMRRKLEIGVLSALIATLAVMGASSCRRPGQETNEPARMEDEESPLDAAPPVGGSVASGDDAPPPAIEEFCTTCHVLPPADCEPREAWAAKIRQMYHVAQSVRPVQLPIFPPVRETIDYYTSRAPDRLLLSEDAMGSSPSPLVFKRRAITLDAIPDNAAVSSVAFARLRDDAPTQLLVSDMRHGVVVLWTPSDRDQPAQVVGRASNPSHANVVDLDMDGLRDILVADLGVFWNQDTTNGAVVWLRARRDGEFETIVLLDGISRVNDVQAEDFDDDGDLDLVVAIFGNMTTGRIVYMENLTEDWSRPDFEAISLDEHTGASDVPVRDLNGDGQPDFIALQSQESERVVAFLNRKGSFVPETIYAAPHPRWGSTGIRLIDMDEDGDVDVLLNHGDAIEYEPVLRPYHGFGWLENDGSFPFGYHRLAHLPGAHTSLCADLDGDGDRDLVSSVFIPFFDPKGPGAASLETVVWLEQVSPGSYRRYYLETGTPFHPCGALGDYDDDGDIDIVLGNFSMSSSERVSSGSCITVLENRLAHGADGD